MTTNTGQYAGANQARQPAGSPNSAGGQFTTTEKAQPSVMLDQLSDEEYNADGSYYFPPYPRSASQHIAFWMSVPLPEAKLRTLINAYPPMREKIGQAAAGRAVDAYKAENPDPTTYSDSDEARAEGKRWSAEVGQVYDAAFNQAVADMPSTVYYTTTRPLLRAHQMYVHRLALPSQEVEVVDNYEISVDGVPMTVKSIVRTYELERLSDELLKPVGPLAGPGV